MITVTIQKKLHRSRRERGPSCAPAANRSQVLTRVRSFPCLKNLEKGQLFPRDYMATGNGQIARRELKEKVAELDPRPSLRGDVELQFKIPRLHIVDHTRLLFVRENHGLHGSVYTKTCINFIDETPIKLIHLRT